VADRLRPYRAKRDFEATPEPPPGTAKAAPERERFVVHEHHARRLHWDLRLERDGVLVSWAVPKGIPDDPAQNHLAVHVEDHPLSYIDFKGEIPAGNYGAGQVKIWDHGTYDVEKFREDEVIVVFHGERLTGRYVLFQTRGKDWMIHRMDPPADPAREPLPERVRPMLARLGDLPADGEHWAYEVKWDGVRALVWIEHGELVRAESRTGRDITARYPELRGLGRALGARPALLDGEIVALDAEGRPSFERLQGRMHVAAEAAIRRRAESTPVTFMAFDVLHLDGRSTLARPWSERRELLEGLGLDGTAWKTPAAHRGDGAAFLGATHEQGLEGIVAKRLDSPYEPGRRGEAWLKIKNHARQELVVGGWMPGEGRRRNRIGALLVGHHEDGDLRYAGRVGTGFTQDDLERLGERLAPLERETSPFTKGRLPKGAVWVDPVLVAEVEFTEWTSAGVIRHPSFKGLRNDKPAAEVVREGREPADSAPAAPEPPRPAPPAAPTGQALEIEVDGRTLKLSNLDKVFYPRTGFTKGQVVDYYVRVAPVLLPHLRGRPLTLKRYPDGVDGQSFYEKQCPRHRPDWVTTAPVWSRRNEKEILYCLADDLPTLVWLANLADLELHTSLSRAKPIERPTSMVFDLDPGPPADVIDCAQVALWVRELFAGLELETVVKTSGSKGLQVYVPLNTKTSYEKTKPFAQAVAERLEREHPDRVVSRMAKNLRRGKVLVDWSQNDQHKTTVNVYSLRARERPTVSLPVRWEEVETAASAEDPDLLTFDSVEALERVAEHGDLFAPLLELEQRVPRL
jgi:bifunctional non-homologous end joining protein LigD